MQRGSRNPEGMCRLCLKVGQLQRSHFLPAAVYRCLDPGNNRHVVLTTSECYTTSRQVTAHLLCRSCEQRLNQNGEQWVLKNGFRGQDNFPLQSTLQRSPIRGRTSSGVYFAGAGLPGVDMDQLCYFGASVFWRASTYRWPGSNHIDLGHIYVEEFRRFLNGEAGFPANAVLVIYICGAGKTTEAAIFPYGGRVRKGTFHEYRLILPGMLFILAVGQRIPAHLKLLCSAHSTERLIFLSSRAQELQTFELRELLADNKMAGTLAL